MQLQELLKEAAEKKASDLHIVAGVAPSFRINGEIVFSEHEALSADACKKIIFETLTALQIKEFSETRELNVSLYYEGITRVRMNVYLSKGCIEAACRLISPQVHSIQELGLPMAITDLTRKPNGLVLITGAAGMGKTTTMAAMIDYLNKEGRRQRVVIIEDPVEYVHTHGKSVIIQREVGQDTQSFGEALKQALRQDPNIICIGEMRDLETISIALTAAETGHLVFATLHTMDASQTIYRIIDSFPPHQQNQIRMQLSMALQGVISQKLIPRGDNKGRVLAYEILMVTPAVRNIIKDGNVLQIETTISTSANLGMIGMDKCLKNLYTQNIITYETAMSHVKNPQSFKSL